MSSPLAKSVSQFALLIALCGLFSACGHEPVRQLPDTREHRTQRTAGEQAAVVAARQVGVPYRYGGSSIAGFDCSGLMQFAYASAGKRIPRTTAGQWRELSPVSAEKIRVGDVLFFRIHGKISHVGMYLGRGRFVHAPSSGRKVSVEKLNSDYYRKRLIRGGRPL